MFKNIQKEKLIRKALRAIARQRVALILQPGNVMVVENSTPDAEWFNLAVKTAHIRGWVEILHASMPMGHLRFQGKNPVFPNELENQVMYRLTEGGWAVINRSHTWIIATFFISFIGVVATLVSWA